ncbi:transposase family protein [Streptomyces sp. NPDC058301]|uniref:transposase family protein n=1 Tax=Streptomyces sp. NPDC058301 TaxID=3346436 RepID=UPI0036E07F3B
MPDPRDPLGVGHALVVMFVLTACAVLAGATSLLVVGEWITDAPPSALERPGLRPDPLFPKRCLPAEATVRRLTRWRVTFQGGDQIAWEPIRRHLTAHDSGRSSIWWRR